MPESIAEHLRLLPRDAPGQVKMAIFLAARAHMRTQSAALRAAGMSRQWANELTRRFPAYRDAEDAAVREWEDSLEDEMIRRGRDGVDEPVVFQGQIQTRLDPTTGLAVPVTVRKYSDKLLADATAANVPKYRSLRRQAADAAIGVLVVPIFGTVPLESVLPREGITVGPGGPGRVIDVQLVSEATEPTTEPVPPTGGVEDSDLW